jgi:hypothetical protein
LQLQFSEDVLAGATAIGLTEHIGVTRGLIEPRMHLEAWNAKLMAPTRRARWRLCRGFAAGSQRRIGGENL